MSQKELAYTVAKALYCVQTLEPNLACHLYLDFRSIWYFLPHNVQAALMAGVENNLLLFANTRQQMLTDWIVSLR